MKGGLGRWGMGIKMDDGWFGQRCSGPYDGRPLGTETGGKYASGISGPAPPPHPLYLPTSPPLRRSRWSWRIPGGGGHLSARGAPASDSRRRGRGHDRGRGRRRSRCGRCPRREWGAVGATGAPPAPSGGAGGGGGEGGGFFLKGGSGRDPHKRSRGDPPRGGGSRPDPKKIGVKKRRRGEEIMGDSGEREAHRQIIPC